MASIRRLISDKVAAASYLRRPRLSLPQTRGCSKLCRGGTGDSSLRRVSSPWLMLPPSSEKGSGGMSYNFFSLTQNKVVSLKKNYESPEWPNDDALVVGSSHGWLALYSGRYRTLFLSNPITGEHIKLPPIDESLFEKWNEHCAIRRMVLSSHPHNQDCRAVMSFFGELAVCSPGRSSVWTTTADWRGISHEDVVYSTTDKLFLCLSVAHNNKTGTDLEAWDATYPLSPKKQWLDSFCHLRRDDENYPFFARSNQERQLNLIHVANADKLLLVKRHFVEHMAPDGSPVEDHSSYYGYPQPHKTIGFDVHVIDRRRRKLSYMEDSLDGLALFVGLNSSFAVEAAEFPGLKADSIYFTEGEAFYCPTFSWTAARARHSYSGHDIGIFVYKRKTIDSCYYPCDRRSVTKIYPPPFWFTPSPY